MRIISRKPLTEFSKQHPHAKDPLNAWYYEALNAKWKNTADIKAVYNTADVVANNRVIFNIGGNKYRLIVAIAYKSSIIYIKFIGTHKQYDKIDAVTTELK